ncbi:hypothetical protein HZB06_01910 [Candidatus Wolfebacteria bacterium]|nr:hypothetical protein [Candidatus Wolfebacteria bacterium]
MANLIISIKEVFSRFSYFVFSLIVFLSLILVFVWLPNFSLLAKIFVSSDIAVRQKIIFLLSGVSALKSNFTLFSAAITILIAFLSAINFGLAFFYIKRQISAVRSAVGLGGILSGFLGVGCASCGSVILSSIFGVGATAGFISILPLAGKEFSVLSVVLLGLSIFLISQKIQESSVCRIKNRL